VAPDSNESGAGEGVAPPAAGSAGPQAQESGSESATPGALVDQAGRPLGPRALQTRQRILDATVSLLEEKPMRDLRVIDIARRVGSSPATFYQYFKDVEDAVVHLADEASKRTPEMVDLIRGDWSGQAGYERARKLVELTIEHWDRHAPVLRVRNNASDEGEPRFIEVRRRAMLPLVQAFGEALVANRGRDRERRAESHAGVVHPTVGGSALVSVLDRLAMYHANIEEMGATREELVETSATLLHTLMTSGC
jgi:AcrR family transcriptional regulator